MSNKGKVLIAAPVHAVLTEGLEAEGYTCVAAPAITQETAYGLIADCAGVITSTRLQLDRKLLDAAHELKWIGRMGSGMEVIDLDYAREKGIDCFGSPEGNCNAVGEHALGMLLTLIRRISIGQAEIRNGIWLRDENRGTELEGKTIGLIGFGHTGRSFARKLLGFDMHILAYDKYNDQDVPPYVTFCTNLEDIFRQADIVSFHVPYHTETIHYFNDAFLHAMARPFILINTSRGMVVDTNALYDGVLSGKILGACLDVYEAEPISKMNEEIKDKMQYVVNSSNVIATPHIAGYTFEALYKMSKALLVKAIGRL